MSEAWGPLPPVLVVTHLFPATEREHRGPWVAEQVDALAASVDISVLCCSQTATDRTEVRPSGVQVTLRSTRTVLGGGRLGLLASSLRYDRALAAHLRANPDIGLLHAHFGIPDAIIARRRAARTGIPYVVTLHGDDAFKVLPRADPIGRAVRRAVTEASAVICVSEAMARAVSAVVDVEPVVISNGYDDALFRVSHLPRDGGLLYVGNLVPTKNLPTLLRAYARVLPATAMPLTIVGDGPLRASLASLARTLGVPDRVRFLGVQGRREVADLMARAAALVLPSLSEGWGVVIAESLASGTPVVASRVGGVPEILGSDDGGILVAPGDEDALAAGLAAIASRQVDPGRVAAASRARPWSVQAARIAAEYRKVLISGVLGGASQP
jgi:glycosyltransferase involved in cell wall biosynthesis